MSDIKCDHVQIIKLGPQSRVKLKINLDTGAWDASMSLGGGYMKPPHKPFQLSVVECPDSRYKYILSLEGRAIEIIAPNDGFQMKHLCD